MAILSADSSLTPGTRLGPYRIEQLIGAGGMGQVYCASDTRLGRTVAIKVLPQTLAGDPQFRARFDREAQAIAGLAHPCICTLYDVGHERLTDASGTEQTVDYLVLEYLEGETLAARLESGALPFPHALACAIQIADALDAAHRRGVVHRDLKPGNIMLVGGGGASAPPTAKLLDFGLAKSAAPAIAGLGPSHVPTTPLALTAQGTILGTFQYMAPEQLEGREADARTDIFAFGAVVYEMFTGKKAFDGKSHASLIGAIMQADPPPVSATQSMTPPSLDHIVRTCLAKHPEDRWQTARDLGRELRRVREHATDQRPVARSGRSISTAAAAAMLGVALAGAFAVWRVTRPAPASPVVTRFTVELPDDGFFTNTGRQVIALSPTGTHLAYVANSRLYVRALDQLEAAPLRGIESTGATAPVEPFFSPDGQWVGFFQSGQIKKVSITGGTPLSLAPLAAVPYGVTWAADNTILIGIPDGVWKVSGNGGTPELLVRFPQVNPERAYGPQLLPGGRAVLFTLGRGSTNWDEAQIVVHVLATGEQKTVLAGGTDARYLPTGHLVYVRRGTLYGVRFDLTTLSIVGQPVALVEGVSQSTNLSTGAAHFAVSNNGTLVYLPASASGIRQRTLIWVDRNGREERIAAEPRAFIYPRLSPDGTRIALDIADENRDIWIWDLTRSTLTRLTSDVAVDRVPAWTADGKRIIFGSDRDRRNSLYWQPADGSGAAELLKESIGGGMFPYGVTRDGAYAIVRDTLPDTAGDIFTLSLDADRRLQPLLQTPAVEMSPELSPDQKWLAYQSNSSGRPEIYVRPFPDLSRGQWPVSTAGGVEPLWARSGRELFYRALDGSIMSVAVSAAESWSAGAPTKLFDGPYASSLGAGNNNRVYDVAADGRRFLMIKRGAEEESHAASQFVVVHNWFEELERRVTRP